MSKPVAHLTGKNGNIFNLISIARLALKGAGQPNEAEKMTREINENAKSYEHALQIIMKYVDVR